MSRAPLLFALALCLVGPSGCYRVRYDTERPRGREVALHEEFWLWGVHGVAVVDTPEHCPEGVAALVSQTEFLDLLQTLITAGLYAPRTIRLYCAAGPVVGR